MKKIPIIIIICFVIYSNKIHAQRPWPAITQTAKPWTRWWWQGSAVDKPSLKILMAQYAAAGLGGLEITPIYGVKGEEASFINFLSPQWMNMLTYTLQEAKILHLGIDMANATGWPFGGPWVKPADACKNVQYMSYQLKEGESIDTPIRFLQKPFYRSESRMQVDLKTLLYPIANNKNLQLYAFDQVRFEKELRPSTIMAYSNQGTVLDLSALLDTAGVLHWRAPEGNWKLYALFIGDHGKMVERAAPGGEGDVIDHFSATALQHYLHRFDQVFAGKNIKGIRSFFNDSYEVDDAKGQSNWTPALLAEFEKRRGYDVRTYLPQLLERDSSAIGKRVLCDYRLTISELLFDNFTKPWQHWAAGQHIMVRNQSHGSPANILDLYAAVDIPETEGADILRYKFATSTAHVAGKQLASAESATWLGEHFQSTLSDVKQAADKYFVGGVNHLFWHGTVYSPPSEPWPGRLFYAAVHFTQANTWWNDFSTLNKYVARCQSFLQKGNPDNDILLYYPFYDRISAMGKDLLLHFDGMDGFEKTSFKSSAEWLLNKGYSFDLISDKQLLGVEQKNKTLRTGGVHYQTIVFSNIHFLPLSTLQKLVKLAKEGAYVIFYQQLPEEVPGMFDLLNQQKQFKQIWDSLHFIQMENGQMKKAILGKGAFLLGMDLENLLAASTVRRETMVDKGLMFTRRKYNDGHCYFITNLGKTQVKEWIQFRCSDKAAYLFNPMTGENGVSKFRILQNNLELYIQLSPDESVIVQTTNTSVAGRLYPYFIPIGSSQSLTGNWDIHFLNGGPALPEDKKISALTSWTAWSGEATKSFSGSATYSLPFEKPRVNASHYLLDLGQVAESAQVYINGKKISVLIGPAFQVLIPASILKAQNILQVIVTNGMANRIADLDKKGVVWKRFYNTNFPARFPQNRGADGLFTAINWEPEASGLMGPVTIQPGKLMEKK
jgi:hypothetical protein